MVIRTGILHVPELDESASRGVRALLQRVAAGSVVLLEQGVASQRNWIEETLRTWCDEEELDLVLTVGGTYPAPGPSAEEAVPEATQAVLERSLPGLSEAMRAAAQEETVLALLDRGVAGIRGRSLIINLPAGEGPAVLFLESVAELIEPVLLHLSQSPDAPRIADELDDSLDQEPPGINTESDAEAESSGLNADEFAAFLNRRTDD